MNGPLKMYLTKQIIKHDTPIELPNIMYKIKNLHSTRNGSLNKGPTQSSTDNNLSITQQVKQFLQNNVDLSEIAQLTIRQKKILEQLEDLKKQMLSVKVLLNFPNKCSDKQTTCVPCEIKKKVDVSCLSDLVINVHPSYLPYSLVLLKKILNGTCNMRINFHQHSSINSLPESTKKFMTYFTPSERNNNGLPEIFVRLIWKDVGMNQMELLISTAPILGECNFLRYLARVTQALNYDEMNYEIDTLIDLCYHIANCKTKTDRASALSQLYKRLSKSEYFFGKTLSIGDICAYSVLKQTSENEVNVSLTKWVTKLDNM